MHQTTISTNTIATLQGILQTANNDKVLFITDNNVKRFCFTKDFCKQTGIDINQIITISAGDENKSIYSAIMLWEQLVEKEATRHTLIVNVGGGMITDIGGFVASTFKRGVEYINISTTLLGAVDAATGGKTGINFMGYKNEIGVFKPAKQVIIAADLFTTLNIENIRSGFSEMIKHALISSPKDFNDSLKFDLDNPDFQQLNTLLERNVRIKEGIVERDPYEKNVRKALNLGHTVGHALESHSHTTEKPALHGYAIIWGIVAELYLSQKKLQFPKETLLQMVELMKTYYGKANITCKQYDTLIELMRHDKKNLSADQINFTLLSGIGEIHINQTVSKEEIKEALDFLQNC